MEKSDEAPELRPKPISDEEYHDHNLVAIKLKRGEVEWLIESPVGTQTAIRLVGVQRLLAMDVLEGNIIDCIDCHRIESNNVAMVLGEFGSADSAYYNARTLSDIERAGGLVTKLFVAIRPIHGASILAIADAVTEAPVAQD